MAYELIWEAQGVHKRLSGLVAAEEFLASVEAIQRHERFDEVRYVINDFSAVTGHGLTDRVLAELAALHYGAYATNPRCRILYVTRDEHLAGLVKKHLEGGFGVSYPVAVVASLAEARDWVETRPGAFRLVSRAQHRNGSMSRP